MSSMLFRGTPCSYTKHTHTAVDRTPYTYLIGWSALNLWYYGVRYAKGCHPNDLLVKYFTSSKLVKNLIKEHGIPNISEIRAVFTSITSAREWEHKVITRCKMVMDNKFINRCSSTAIHPEDAIKATKGKTYQEIYGDEKANLLKQSRIFSNSTRNCEYVSGRNHGNHGNIMSDEFKDKTSKISKDRWDDSEFRIKMAQAKNSHYTQLIVCQYCSKLFKYRKNTKFCSKTCSNKHRYSSPYHSTVSS